VGECIRLMIFQHEQHRVAGLLLEKRRCARKRRRSREREQEEVVPQRRFQRQLMRERRHYKDTTRNQKNNRIIPHKHARLRRTVRQSSMSSTPPRPTVVSALTLCTRFACPFLINPSNQSIISPVRSLGSTPNNAVEEKRIKLNGHEGAD
jgi:hypothetical protein